MLEFLRTGKALSVLAAVGAVGLISKLVTRSLYKRLLKEADNMAVTKNKNLRNLKQKLENAYRLNQNIANTEAYLERQIYGFQYLHISLNVWNNTGLQMAALGLFLGGCASFFSYWYRMDSYYIVLYASAGALGSLFLLFVDSSFHIALQQKRLFNALLDYADNSVFIRAVRDNQNRLNARERIPEKKIKKEKLTDEKEDEKETELSETGIRNGIVRESERKKPQSRAAVNRSRKAGELLRTEETAKRQEKTAEAETKSRAGFSEPDEEENVCRDIDYIKRSLEQIAAGRERMKKEDAWVKNMDSEEMKILGEMMRQYFAGD